MKKLLYLILGLGIIGLAYGLYLYNKPHRNVLNEEPVFTGEVRELQDVLASGVATFDSLYADQVIALFGTVTQVNDETFVLDHIVVCQPDSTQALDLFTRGEDIHIKGKVVGAEEDLIEGSIIRIDRVYKTQ